MHIFITILLFVLLYVFILIKVHGTSQEKLVFIIFRCLVLVGLLLLFLSPRFDLMHREWKYPIFYILEDDSPSVTLQRTAISPPPFLAQIKDQAKVIQTKFSEHDIANRFSISAQIQQAYRKEPTVIILVSDGNESLAPLSAVRKDIPIFTVPCGLESFPDTHIVLSEYPEILYQYQSQTFSGYVYKNFPERGSGLLQFMMNGELVSETALDLEQEKTPWQIDCQLVAAGSTEFSFVFTPEKTEQILANNRLNFFADVSDRKQNILFIAGSPSSDLAFYLRTLRLERSIDTQVYYTEAALKNPNLSDLQPDLLVFYNLPYQKAQPFLEKFPLLARIYIFGQEASVLLSWRDKNLLPLTAQPTSFRHSLKPEYKIDEAGTGLFNFFSHESYERSVLSMLEPLRSPLNLFRLEVTDKSIFSMYNGADKLDLVFFNLDKKPVYAVINSTDLSIFPFSPFFSQEKKELYHNLLKTIFSVLLNHEHLYGLNLQSTGSFVPYGQNWRADVQGLQAFDLSFWQLESNTNIYTAKSPVSLQLPLNLGNYRLNISLDHKLLKSLPVCCGYLVQEFTTTGINREYLQDLSEQSDGRLYHTAMTELNDFIPAKLFEKSLKIHKTAIDLQKSLMMLLVMFLLLSAEWVYRYLRKLV